MSRTRRWTKSVTLRDLAKGTLLEVSVAMPSAFVCAPLSFGQATNSPPVSPNPPEIPTFGRVPSHPGPNLKPTIGIGMKVEADMRKPLSSFPLHKPFEMQPADTSLSEVAMRLVAWGKC